LERPNKKNVLASLLAMLKTPVLASTSPVKTSKWNVVNLIVSKVFFVKHFKNIINYYNKCTEWEHTHSDYTNVLYHGIITTVNVHNPGPNFLPR